jgi:hypothetical protein
MEAIRYAHGKSLILGEGQGLMFSGSLYRRIISQICGGDAGGDSENMPKNKELKINVSY